LGFVAAKLARRHSGINSGIDGGCRAFYSVVTFALPFTDRDRHLIPPNRRAQRRARARRELLASSRDANASAEYIATTGE